MTSSYQSFAGLKRSNVSLIADLQSARLSGSEHIRWEKATMKSSRTNGPPPPSTLNSVDNALTVAYVIPESLRHNTHETRSEAQQ